MNSAECRYKNWRDYKGRCFIEGIEAYENELFQRISELESQLRNPPSEPPRTKKALNRLSIALKELVEERTRIHETSETTSPCSVCPLRQSEE